MTLETLVLKGNTGLTQVSGKLLEKLVGLHVSLKKIDLYCSSIPKGYHESIDKLCELNRKKCPEKVKNLRWQLQKAREHVVADIMEHCNFESEDCVPKSANRQSRLILKICD